MQQFKSFFSFSALLPVLFLVFFLGACSTNPATGKQQFAALMSPQQELQVGASEHQKVVAQYGLVSDQGLQSYVSEVGRKVTTNTERPDVQYKFFVIDSPIVNAFALPGGYIYVSRGLLALANNEAELASVLGHEAGHITGRHSAERYSHGVVTSLGAGILGAALGSQEASQALGVGANLYLSSYSREQENEADTLGLRYMTRGGYQAQSSPSFLYALQQEKQIEDQLNGRNSDYSYFSTHPATQDRVNKTSAEAGAYPAGGAVNHERHLKEVNGMVYGDSAAHGFTRGQSFYHPKIGFTFSVPDGFTIQNQPDQVVAGNKQGAVIIFDMASNAQGLGPMDYVRGVWLKQAQLQSVENITINGMQAATASFAGQVSGRPATIRVIAVAFKDGFARFQMAIPSGASGALVEDLKRTTYSFRAMNETEKNSIQPYRIRLYAAKSGDTVSSIAQRMPFDQLKEQRFRVLNGLNANENVQAGELYKIVSEN